MNNLKPVGNVDARNRWAARQCGAERRRRGAPDWLCSKSYSRLLGQTKRIALGKEGRVLPQPLRTHTPGRIVINGITGAEHGLVAAEHFPRQADSRLERRPILL